jgi:hypothetical protein
LFLLRGIPSVEGQVLQGNRSKLANERRQMQDVAPDERDRVDVSLLERLLEMLRGATVVARRRIGRG